MISRIVDYVKSLLTPQASMNELAAELRMPRPESRSRERRKTKKGAKHVHRPSGRGRRRRAWLPAILSVAKKGRITRRSCRFVYSRPSRQRSRNARLSVIKNNDRIENAMQEARRRRAA